MAELSPLITSSVKNRIGDSQLTIEFLDRYKPLEIERKGYVHVEDGDDARTMRAKVTGHLLTLDETLQETIPAVLSLLDVLPGDSPFLQLDPSQRRQRTLDALKRILLRESQVQPLLLVFEDLHWIDSETQALLDSLVESVPAAQLLLLINYRPEYQHEWGNKTFYTQLRLDPLPPENADALLEALLGDDLSLEPLKKLLIERTEGNPFFLEESVRTLVETQVLVGEPGAYRRAHDLLTIQVPPTVQAVLAARMDRLPQEEKRLLQTAAVIGTEVPLPLLEAIDELSEAARHRGLVHLQAAEFLYETSLFPDRVYTFKHALTHEVAYSSLLQERRRMLHVRIVEALEALVPDLVTEQAERLAHHALRGEVWDKAVAYCQQAGARAYDRAAFREAVAAFEQALAALEHLPDSRAATEQTIDLQLGLRAALNPLRGLLDHLRRAETLAEMLGDQLRLGRIYADMGITCWVTGEVDRAIIYGQRTLALATPLGHIGLQAWAHLILGRAYYDMGDYARAVESLERNAMTLQGELRYERFGGNVTVAVDSLSHLSLCHAELGTFTEGLAMAEEGLRIAEAVNHPFSLIVACSGVGLVYLRQGNVHRAIPVLERAMELCQDRHIALFLPRQAGALGVAYALDGRVAAGLALVEQGVAQEVAAEGRLRRLAPLVAWLSEAYLLAGRLEDAYTRAAQAVELARQYQQRGNQAWALWLLGESTASQTSPAVEVASDHYCQALALAHELGMRPLQAHCHHSLGTLYSETRRPKQARGELSKAIDMYREMEMTFWLLQAEVALTQVA